MIDRLSPAFMKDLCATSQGTTIGKGSSDKALAKMDPFREMYYFRWRTEKYHIAWD